MATTKRYRVSVPARLYFDVVATSRAEAKRMASGASLDFNEWDYLAEIHVDLDSEEAKQMQDRGVVFPPSGPGAVVYADAVTPGRVEIADEEAL